MQMNQATDVAVLGGGVEGCSIAYHLSKAGVPVSVIERADLASEASSAAAGLLAPGGVLTGPKAGADLFFASWSMTPALIEEIEAVSGVHVEYQQTGSLHVVTDEDQEEHVRRYEQAWRARNITVEWMTGDELRRDEPLLNPEITTALSLPHTSSIRPRLMTKAYAEAARALGAHIYEHTEATGFRLSGSKVRGVETARGETLACQRVVIAAGAWSAQVGEWLGLEIPVFPARGQILSLRQPETALNQTIFGRDIYVVPKVDHTISVGATVERVGFEKRNTAGGVLWLLQRALNLLPQLEGAELVHIWSGLRPASQDSSPILGTAAPWENVFLATGHGAGGFELSAITGQTIAELMITGRTPPLIQPFSIDRFAQQAHSNTQQ